MSVNEIHVGDVGTVMQATVMDNGTAVDISGMTTKYFLLHQPGGSVTTISAVFVGSGTAGVIAFTSTAAHFDQMGKFKLQAHVSNGSQTWRTDIYTFDVFPNLA